MSLMFKFSGFCNRYAEDRWDDVMGRLTEVLADQAAQQGMPHGPEDGRPRHALDRIVDVLQHTIAVCWTRTLAMCYVTK